MESITHTHTRTYVRIYFDIESFFDWISSLQFQVEKGGDLKSWKGWKKNKLDCLQDSSPVSSSFDFYLGDGYWPL